MGYWLIKTEPGCFSIDDLAAAPGGVTAWDGVRNFQARNFLRDGMRLGDGLLFYHSVTDPGVAGLAEVAREAYPDITAQDPESGHLIPGPGRIIPFGTWSTCASWPNFPRSCRFGPFAPCPSWPAWNCCARARVSRSCP